MTDDNRHPDRIWATVNGSRVPMGSASTILIGGWESRQHRKAAAYVRADVADEALAALKEIAAQKRTDEIETEYDVECADFEEGYDACINRARAAIAKLEGGGA